MLISMLFKNVKILKIRKMKNIKILQRIIFGMGIIKIKVLEFSLNHTLESKIMIGILIAYPTINLLYLKYHKKIKTVIFLQNYHL